MAQVATTGTVTDQIPGPSIGSIVRDVSTGYLYVAYQSAAGTLTVNRSTDAGATWVFWASFTQSGLAEWSSLVIDGNWGHIAYRISTTGTGGTDTIWYRRLLVSGTTGSFSNGLQTSSSDANGGTAGATWQGLDLVAVRNSNGSYCIAIAGARTQGTTRYGIQIMGVTISADASTIAQRNELIGGTRQWWTNGTAPGRSGVVMDLEHNGNGQTAATPNVWITWGRSTSLLVKLSWLGATQGWSGPTNPVVIRAALAVQQDFCTGRWDGSQFMVAVASPDDTTKVRIYQRNKANTSTTVYDTSTAHPQGVVRYLSLSYDNTTKNIRVYAIGTSGAVIYYIDYVRATSTWTTWTAVNGATVLGATEWATRRGGSSGSARHDLIYGVSASPNTLQHFQQTQSTAPNVATWNYSITPTNGSAADVAAVLPLAWNFQDADPGDTQGFYSVSRQIGTGTIAYWRASDSTWQATEVQNASATSQLNLPAGWGADADAVHQYRVKVYDAAGTGSAAYSEALQIVPSAKSNPTITAPAAAAVLTSNAVTLTWTVADQSAYRVRLTQTAPTAAGVLYDSGKQISTATSLTVPYALANATGWTIELTTYNAEGLASTAQARSFTVSYAPPPASAAGPVPVPASGWMAVSATALTPVGTQPAIVSQDLYRRVKLYSTLNPNSDMAGTVSGWIPIGGTLTYSTAQSYSSPGSARLVPNGTAPDCLVRLSTPIDVTAIAAANGVLVARGWIRPDTANKSIRIEVDFYDASNNLLGFVPATITAVVAGAWQYIRCTADFTAYPTGTKAGVSIGLTGTPAAGDAFYADDVTLRRSNPDRGIRISQLQGVGANINDWQAPGATDLEYQWVGTGANGTTITGPWGG